MQLSPPYVYSSRFSSQHNNDWVTFTLKNRKKHDLTVANKIIERLFGFFFISKSHALKCWTGTHAPLAISRKETDMMCERTKRCFSFK